MSQPDPGEDPPTNRRSDGESLRSQFATTELSRHLALFYRHPAEQLPVVSAFVDRGLGQGERVIYVADENDVSTVAAALAEGGVDVSGRRQSGQLRIVESGEVYAGTPFDPDRSVEAFEQLVNRAVADGYSGLRIAGENTWSFGLDCEFDRVIEFEVGVDSRCPEFPVRALCQYSLDQFDDAGIGKALQTHEQIVYRGQLCQNPYYVHPEDATGSGHLLSNATLLLEQVRDVHQFQRGIEAREQRLSVVNRVLRHNLRNDINVIKGRLEWLEDEGDLNETAREQLETVQRTADRLLGLAEKARRVDRTVESVDRTRTDLETSVADAIDTVLAEHPGGDVTVETDLSAKTVADGAVELALVELLAMAVENGTENEARLTVEAESAREVTVVVEAENFVPGAAQEAIEAGVEGALRHAPGLSLWVANWIADEVNGSLEIPREGSGESVRLTVPTVSL